MAWSTKDYNGPPFVILCVFSHVKSINIFVESSSQLYFEMHYCCKQGLFQAFHPFKFPIHFSFFLICFLRLVGALEHDYLSAPFLCTFGFHSFGLHLDPLSLFLHLLIFIVVQFNLHWIMELWKFSNFVCFPPMILV
jgi:hypothetical protein